MGKFVEAVAHLKRVIDIDPKDASAHNSLGAILNDNVKDHAGAIAAFRTAITLNPKNAHYRFNLGNAFRDNGQLDDASAAYREALSLKKDFVEAYHQLGLLLVRQGRFADAVPELKHSLELGSKIPGWTHTAAQWVRRAEQLAQLDERLAAVLEGKAQPKDTAERLAFAGLCQKPYRQRYATALRFYEEAFADVPELTGARPSPSRYAAACAAALAGCGHGKDTAHLDTMKRAALRRQALEWLRGDLAGYQRWLANEPDKAGPLLCQRMQAWQQDADLAGVRAPESLGRLPAVEQKDWRELWEDVKALGQRAAQRPAAANSARP